MTKCNSYKEFLYKEKKQDGTLAKGMWSWVGLFLLSLDAVLINLYCVTNYPQFVSVMANIFYFTQFLMVKDLLGVESWVILVEDLS